MNRNLDTHISAEVERLRADFRLMGDLVSLGLNDAMEALRDGNRQKGYRVILRDSDIDAMETRIDRHCLEFLTKFTPAGSNLRFVFSAAKMSSEIERVGDYAESIARQAIELSYSDPHPIVQELVQMSEISIAMFQWAIRAFLESDAQKATLTTQREREVDAYEHRIYETLMNSDIPSADEAKRIYSLLNIANRIERVADQACNICEEAVYMATGHVLKHHHERQFKILFLSEDNACRSQMAEAIGKKLGAGSRFHFFSAGANPAQAIDPTAIDLLKERGVTVVGQKPRSLEEIEPLKIYDVVVTFRDGAVAQPPRAVYKNFALTWTVPEPKVAGRLGYEKAFDELKTRIRDLMLALSH